MIVSRYGTKEEDNHSLIGLWTIGTSYCGVELPGAGYWSGVEHLKDRMAIL